MVAHTGVEKIAAVTKLSRWTNLSREEFHELLSPDCQYINVPLPDLRRVGPDEAMRCSPRWARIGKCPAWM